MSAKLNSNKKDDQIFRLCSALHNLPKNILGTFYFPPFFFSFLKKKKKKKKKIRMCENLLFIYEA